MMGVFVQTNSATHMAARKPVGYVIQENGCWEWVGSLGSGGYGKAWVNSRDVYAHRLMYEQECGPVPDGMELDHLCRNRKCVNPAHLEPVTARENSMRGVGITAQCAKKTHCPHGHELSPDNLVPGQRRRGIRECLTCQRGRNNPTKRTAL